MNKWRHWFVGKWRHNWVGPLIFTVVLLTFFGRYLFGKKVLFYGDIKLLFYPLEFVYGQFQRAGRLPLWSNEFGFGQPLISWGQLGFFTPLHVFLRTLGLHALELIQISMVVYFGLGLAGMFVFLRRRGLLQLAAALGAVVFVFSGYNVSHIVHLNFFVGVMLVPWLLVAVDCFLEKITVRRAVALAAMAAVIAMSTHAQITLYSFLLVALAGFFLVRKWTKKLVIYLLLSGVLGFCLSSLAILPLVEFLPYMNRNEGMTLQELYDFSYPPWHAVTLIFPSFFGDDSSYWGAKSLLELGAYVGIVPLMLAGAGLANWHRFRRERLLAGTALLVGTVFAWGRYFLLYRLLAEHKLWPPFTAPGRLLMLVVFALAVLSAVGLDDWLKLGRKKLIWMGWLALGAALLPVVLSGWWWPRYWTRWGELAHDVPIEWWLAVAGFAVYNLAAVLPPNYEFRKLWGGAAVALSAATLVVFGWQLYPMEDRTVAFAQSPFARDLKQYESRTKVPARLYSELEILQRGSDSTVPDDVQRTDPLSDNFWVVQGVSPDRDDWSCLDLAIESSRVGSGTFSLSVRERGSQAILRQLEVPVREITDAGRQTFCFEPIEGSSGRDYEIVFRAWGEGRVRLFYRNKQNEGRAYFVRVADPTAEEMDKSRKSVRLVMGLQYGGAVDSEQMMLMRHLNAVYKVSSARWIGSISIRRYRDFVQQLFANDGATVGGDGKHIVERNRAAFDMAGVTHFIQALGEGAVDTMRENGFVLVREEVVRDTKYRLYKNEQVLPRAYLAGYVKYIDDTKEVLRRLKEPGYKPREVVYIEALGGDKPENTDGTVAGRVDMVKYGPTEVIMRVTSDKPAWLVVTDSYTPNWRALVDGEGAKVAVANGLFRAVHVSPGSHIVALVYKSRAVDRAIWLTAGGLAAAVIIFVLSYVNMQHFWLCWGRK